MVKFLGIFDPIPTPWSLLLNKAYVIKWSFGQPPSPSTVHVVYEWPLKEKTRIMRAATILSVYVTFIVMCYIYATISGILMQILICINYVIISVVIPTLFIYANQNIKIFVMKYFKSLFCCFPNLNNINVAHQMNNNNNDIDMHIQHI